MNLQEHVPLAPYTTFGIGGPARWFAEAHTEQDVVEAAAFARQAGVPLFALGGGSNLLVSDDGYPGLVLRIAMRGMEEEQRGQQRIFRVAAGEDWDMLVKCTVTARCAGMECLAGIPGSVGGTPVQNVGAYGQEVSGTIECVRAFDLETGAFVEFSNQDCEFGYRSSRFNTRDRGRYIVTRVDFATLEGGAPTITYADLKRHFEERGVNPTLLRTSQAVRAIRKSKGMVLLPGDPDSRSAGSFFKNPIVDAEVFARIAAAFAPAPVPHYPAGENGGSSRVKLPAAWLLEKAGFHRGFRLGEAGISSRHTLALVNLGAARAVDIAALRDTIQDEVERQFGVRLEPEPVWLGEPFPASSHPAVAEPLPDLRLQA